MRKLRNQEGYWKQCRPGTILGVSDSKFKRQRRRFLIQSAMTGTLASLALFSGLFFLHHRKSEGEPLAATGDNSFGPSDSKERKLARVKLTCKDVAQQMDAFLIAYRLDANERTVMQSELIVDVENHIQSCKSCFGVVQEKIRAV